MTILPLYAAPQYAPQVTDWLWQAFGGETLPRQFFASIVQHSQTAEELPLTFIAVEGEQLRGTIGLWRCDLISRQDLFPWLAALYGSSDVAKVASDLARFTDGNIQLDLDTFVFEKIEAQPKNVNNNKKKK